MSIPKKGSRKITVNGIDYRWAIRKKPTYNQQCFGSSMSCVVELFENSCCTLYVEFSFPRFDNLVISTQNTFSITPKIIEFCIKDSLLKGWKPDKKGSAFKYTYIN